MSTSSSRPDILAKSVPARDSEQLSTEEQGLVKLRDELNEEIFRFFRTAFTNFSPIMEGNYPRALRLYRDGLDKFNLEQINYLQQLVNRLFEIVDSSEYVKDFPDLHLKSLLDELIYWVLYYEPTTQAKEKLTLFTRVRSLFKK